MPQLSRRYPWLAGNRDRHRHGDDGGAPAASLLRPRTRIAREAARGAPVGGAVDVIRHAVTHLASEAFVLGQQAAPQLCGGRIRVFVRKVA